MEAAVSSALDHRSGGRPDFFIVGAPKCGTTAMYAYLRQHPDLYLPAKKELFYFGSDLQIRRPRRTLNEYLAYFSEAGPRQVIGTAHVWALFSTSAASEIRAFNPAAKIIIMLRRPTDMIFALHSESLYNGNEDLESFEAALDAEIDRRAGRRIPRGAHLPEGLLYRRVADYPDQVARYLQVFGRGAVHVVLFDDFVADTAATYRSTLEFLGVDPGFQPSFPVVNANKRARIRVVREFLAQPPSVLRHLIRRVVPAAIRRYLYAWVVERNRRSEARRPMDAHVRARLDQEFAPSIRRLEALIKRDLSGWLAR